MPRQTKVIQQESYTDLLNYRICWIYADFNFDGALKKELSESNQCLCMTSFWWLEDFTGNAYLFLFEAFSPNYQCIHIKTLAKTLSITPKQAERQIVG